MDAQEILTPTVSVVKAKKGHIAMFVIACILLAVAVCSAAVLVATILDPLQIEDPSGDPLATGAALFVGMGYVVAMAILRILFYVSCLIGVIMAAVLVSSRNNKPRWMWVASLAVLVAFMIPAAVLMVGAALAELK